jgi:glycosyltransferase involved in cell wall biosynthesis
MYRNRMPLVSVIVPAHNAEATVAETIESALQQTHADLEIIVVDDGSSDSTLALCNAYRARDTRIRVISTAQAGVASARNTGIENANGQFIAPLDADDLWHPCKIERQLACFAGASVDVALVYNWTRRIDMLGRVVETEERNAIEAWCLHRLLQWNFVGNGSTPLIRRTALGDLRYNTMLRATDSEGCEDYLLELQLAARGPFAFVPAFLTGYRLTEGSMSTKVESMIQSNIKVYQLMAPSLPPETRRVVRRRLADFHVWYLRTRLKRGNIGDALRAGLTALRMDVGTAISSGIEHATLVMKSRMQGIEKPITDPRHFYAWGIEEGGQKWKLAGRRRLIELEQLDRNMNNLDRSQ